MPWLKLLLAALIVGLALGGSFWLLQPLRHPTLTEPVASANVVFDAGVQAAVPEPPAPLPREPNPLSEALCPLGMVWIEGAFCAAGFEGEGRCRVEPLPVAACIDRYEYPNQSGVLPAAMVTFAEARAACEAEGKRLCHDSEWIMACRNLLSLSACRFGARKRQAVRERLWDPLETSRELASVDGRRASGPSDCIGEQGANDLPGNLEEWVLAEGSGGYDAALKGGHFNKSSVGCERTIYVRRVDARSPYVGFRCCSEPLVEPPH